MLNYVNLKIYIVIMSVLIGYLTLVIEQSSIDKFITIAIIFVLFAFLYVNLKLKLSTERKKSEEKLREAENKMKKIAYYDVLTGLPNRYMFNNFINDFIVDVNDKNHNCTAMFIDLDNFKNINDSFGHSIGDYILLQTAEKLKNCVRKSDIVFRYGGDEFIIILRDIQQKDIIIIAERIIKEFKNPFILNRQEIFTSPSIGISFYPTDSSTVETIIRNAYAAMYSVKKMGKNNYKFFSKEIDKAIHRKAELEKALRKALENNEFSLCYQPQIDLDTGDTWGLEALIRWHHPTLGMISPAEFIPLAEEIGLIIPIGEWVLASACRQNKLWQEEGLMNIPVAVNVSAVQLNNSNFVETVKGHLQSTKLNPQYLVIELTESIMQDTSKSVKILRDLKSLGVKVAIDDFGTGYSSLSLLKDLPIDILKIDSYFIKDVVENPNTLLIIKLIIDMGRKLNFSIIVEGIETEQQARIVKRNGCKIVQGYLFSVPLSEKKVKQYLKNIEVSLYK